MQRPCQTICILLVSLLTLHSLYAQSDQSTPTLYFRCVAFEEISKETVYYRNKDQYLPIEFTLGRHTAEYSYNAAHGLELFHQKVNAENEITYITLGKSKYDPTRKHSLYLIDKVQNRNLPLRIFGMDDSLESCPPSHFKFVNLTSSPLGVKFHKTSKALKPGETTTIKAEVANQGGLNTLTIHSAKGKMLKGTQLMVQPKGRKFIFLYPPRFERERIKIRYLPEIVRPQNTEN